MTAPVLVTADDVAQAIEVVLVAHLADVVGQLGWDDVCKPIRDWHQVPQIEALTSANLPAGGIESPGLTGTPSRNGDGTYGCTWRVAVGVFDRAGDYAATQQLARRWPMAVTATVLAYKGLGGLASRVVWVGQELNRIRDRKTVRTFGLGVTAFDVTVDNVMDPAQFLVPHGPLVQATFPTVTVTTPPTTPVTH